jgi:hypothetical protein
MLFFHPLVDGPGSLAHGQSILGAHSGQADELLLPASAHLKQLLEETPAAVGIATRLSTSSALLPPYRPPVSPLHHLICSPLGPCPSLFQHRVQVTSR